MHQVNLARSAPGAPSHSSIDELRAVARIEVPSHSAAIAVTRFGKGRTFMVPDYPWVEVKSSTSTKRRVGIYWT